MDEKTLEMLEQAIQNAIEEFYSLPEGSEEKLKQAKMIEMLCRVRDEDWKIELDGMEKADRRDIDREHMREEVLIHKMQCALEDKKLKWVKPDVMVGWLMTAIMTFVVMGFESSGHIWPKTLMMFIQRPKI